MSDPIEEGYKHLANDPEFARPNRGSKTNEYLEWMKSDEYKEIAEAEEKFFAEHWANDLLDAPHALISVIETKLARAEIGTERKIIRLLENELQALMDTGEEEAYCQGLEHAILLLKGGMEWSETTE